MCLLNEMISIIICSKKRDISTSLRQNIQHTIGDKTAFEIIVIDNSENKYSIFEAYNIGIRKANYEYICFVHEDVLFHSSNWGENIMNHFSDKEIGMIGFAGSNYLFDIPSVWFRAKPAIKYLIQSDHSDQKSKLHNTTQSIRTEAFCVDGFCFFIRKSLFNKISFDSSTFKGFHFYDLDISMQVRKAGYKIIVISDILIEHFSVGSINKEWLESAIPFYYKWKGNSPQGLENGIKKRAFGNIIAFRDLLFITKKSFSPQSTKKRIIEIGWEELKFNIIISYILYYIKMKNKSDKRYNTMKNICSNEKNK